MNKKVLILCESAVMVALATVLSLIKILDLPYGGSVTAFSIVPLVVISYRHGIRAGLLSGLSYGVIQLLLSTSLSYATSFQAAITIIMLDYIFAFASVGFAGLFRNFIKNQVASAVSGTIFVCLIRYMFHVISGCTVWAGVSIPSTDGMIYSLSYNATYMIPEAIINAAFVFWLFGSLNFVTEKIQRAKKADKSIVSTVFSSCAVLSLMISIIIDAVIVFGSLQSPDNGELDITLISQVDFGFVAIITLIGIISCIVFAVVSKLAGAYLISRNNG